MAEISPTGLIQVPQGSFEALWRSGDGGAAALVYLFILRHGRPPWPNEAEQAGLDADALRLAVAKLEREGLLDRQITAPAANKAPRYTATDIANGMNRDAGFKYAVEEAQRLLDKLLSSADLVTLFTLYSWHGLPAEVLILLVRYMVEDFRARFGPESRPTLQKILQEGQRWANNDILTHEAAERHIRFLEGRRSQSGRIQQVLGIHGRAPSVSERKYIDEWIAMGFPPETVALAYDRTVLNCGRLNYSYCAKILKNWHEAGLHTPREAEERDPNPASLPTRKTVGRPAAKTERSNRPVAPPGEAERAAMERMMKRRRERGPDHGTGLDGSGGA